MPYQKTIWVPGGPPGIDADSLNKIEQGIEDAHIEVAKKLNQSGGKMTGQISDEGKTIYTTKQVRNIIISNADPDPAQMQNGDIWFKWV